ncbi:uncharacterized protein LOC141646583 [Silene latifolia]|uniref:uncharacterized protein LOC141646583 n=1 Tax=Silene latifolia TaxID=37657 RepID=UPI003D76A783
MSNNNIRRPKWTPPPPPTPRILQLPRRIHRRKPPRVPPSTAAYGVPPVVLLNSRRREKVVLADDDVEDRESTSSDDVEEREITTSSSSSKSSKWRFEAEMLRAECYLLRMEREVAVKKLESERSSLHRSLKSAVHSLVFGKKKISEGENVSSVIEEEIEELSKKLVELQRRSSGLKSPELQNCSNFDKQASELQKQLEEYNEIDQNDVCVEEVEDLSVASLSTECTRKMKTYGGSKRHSIKLADVEKLRRKMERLSKGKLLKRMEEVYGSMLSASNCSVPSSATSSRRFDLADLSSQLSQEAKSGELKVCSGQCKAIVKRLMEQVKAETQQWSQMQEMLGQVREEMEELQSSRDFWQANALKSDQEIQTLHSEVEELKQKAVSFENKENKLQKQVQELLEELEKSKVRDQETCEDKTKASRDSTPISLGAQLAKEKRPLTCRVKQRSPEYKTMQNKAVDYNEEKRLYKDVSIRPVSAFNRLPFKDIGNVSHLERHNSRRYVYPLHDPKKS